MTVSVTTQAAALGLCLALGTGVGLFYDLLRRLRLSLPWQGLQGALDLLFWLGACGTLFFCGIVLGDGHIRLYMALCLAAGAAVYFLLWSPLARRGLDGAAWCLGRVARLLWAPFRRVFRVLAAPFIKIFRRVQKRGKKRFPFSRLWSKIYCLIHQGSHRFPIRTQRKEAAAHAPRHFPLEK